MISGVSGISGLSNSNITQARAMLEQETVKTQALSDSLNSVSRYGTDEELMSACKEFEAYFMHAMLKEMRKSVGSSDDGLFAKSSSEKLFEDMSDEQVAMKTADSGGIGLATFMYKQMQREREATVSTI